MSQKSKRISILAAAIGATLAIASTTQAQYRIDTGHANDASNRVGSGGINGGDSRIGRGGYNGLTGNQVVTGNVTAGKEFRGFVPYRASNDFRGFTAGQTSDNFIRQSTGTPYGSVGRYNSNDNASTIQPFYGQSRTATLPPGYIQQGIGSTGYVPAPPAKRIDSDLRLGQVLDSPTVALPSPGQTILPGPVDPSTSNSTLYTASSLYGVRQWNAGNESDQAFVSRYANAFGETRSTLSDLQLDAMRREMRDAAASVGKTSITPDTLGAPIDQNAQQKPNATDPNLANPLPKPLESPTNDPIPANQLKDQLPANPLQGDVGTDQSVRSRVLIAPAQQSKANAMLEARRKQVQGETPNPLENVQAAQQYNQDLLRAKQAQEKKAAPVRGATTPQPGGTNQNTQPGEQGSSAVPGPTNVKGNKSAPPKIASIAEGFNAKGPAEILKKGEDLMKQGKWFSAIEQYDLASQVAPNNMLILVGRANAELGGSYYGRAETDIRTAFTNDPAMLEGTYDLRSMIGDERLQFLVKDLKEIAQKNPNKAQPAFLLAYIAYNSDNPRMAAGYLDLAEKRAGANDPFYSLVRKHWTLPAKDESTTPDLNK